MAKSNLRSYHQGYRLRGKTPAQDLRGALGVTQFPPVTYFEEKTTDQAEVA